MKCEYDPSVLDHLRRETTTLLDRIADLRHQLRIERAKRLRAEQLLAIARQDRETWERTTAELMTCGVSLDEIGEAA